MQRKKNYNRKLLFFFLFIGQVLLAQQRKVDSLLSKSFSEYAEMNMVESNRLANDALKLAKEKNYDGGIAQSHLYIAKVLNTIGDNTAAISHLNQLELTNSYRLTPKFQAENFRIRGRAYASLNMYDLSVVEFQKQLKISNKIKDADKRNFSILFAHQNLVQVFKLMQQRDSINVHIQSQIPILKKYKEKEVYHYLSTLYVQSAEEEIQDKKYKEAEINLKKSLELLNKYNSKNTDLTYITLGDLQMSIRKIHEAEQYYKKALESAIGLDNTENIKTLYKKLAFLYSENNYSKDIANDYFRKHQKLEDSIKTINSKTQNLIVQHIINEEVNHIKDKKNDNKIVFLVCSILGAVLFFSIYKKYKKYRLLTLKNEKQKKVLETKLEDNTFEKLLTLAKSNNPEFIILFKQTYPEFISILKSKDPKVRNSELSFCAMAFLNFSTKDISQYTYVTIRAVQIRKNRLRKKYNIPSEIDFNQWMHNLKTQTNT